MARRVSSEDIIEMNELYLKFGTYAAVARATGFSPSTVKKYIQTDYVAAGTRKLVKFDKEIVSLYRDSEEAKNIIDLFSHKSWDLLGKLSSEEEKEVEKLWEEMSI